MPYFANTPEPSIDARDRFIGNGVTKVFSPLSRRPSGQGGLLVMVNGIVQDGLTYGFAANTLTFKNAPPAPTGGAFTNIEVVYLRTSSAPQSVRWTTPIGSNSGTSDALAINYAPVVSSLTNNLVLRGVMTAGTANTSSVPTFSPNGLTAKTIINNDGSSLVAGQIAGTFELRYDLGLDKWVLLNPVAGVTTSQRPGEVCYFACNSAPVGFLKANGAAVSRTTYSSLFTAIGITFGAGDGSTTFNIPELRGEFIRGWDDSRGVDSGRGLGSWQGDDFRYHAHELKTQTGAAGGTEVAISDTGIWYYGNQVNGEVIDQNGIIRPAITFGVGGTETRPRNVSLLACIKY